AGVHLVAQTDANGAYSFENVPPGDYIIEVNAKGFASYVSATLHVARGQSVANDARLSIAGVSESVVVTASGTAQRIDETSKAVSTLDDQAIEARGKLTLTESLRGIPGVRIQQ